LALAAGWAAVLGTFLGAVMPFWRSEAAIAQAMETIRLTRDFDRAEEAYKRAAAADPYFVRPWLGYAELMQLVWEWRGARPGDQRWKQIPILLNQAVILPRNPVAWTLHIRRADKIRELLQRVGSELPPIQAIALGGEIVRETRIASALYPSNAVLHARLAEASAEISMFGDAAKEAEEALRLDQLLAPHPDKRLPDPVRKRLEERLPEWREKAPQSVRLDRAP
jgi:hypothetical protein